jgi:predicted transcriptional regulator
MSSIRSVYQQQYTVSIPKHELLEYVACNEELTKKDYRVFLTLLTELNGYSNRQKKSTTLDPMLYTKIDSEQISEVLGMDESDVKKCIKKLVSEGIIEKGNTNNMKNGYRFTF